MKTPSLIAVATLAFAVAGTAFAAETGEATYEYPQPIVSTKSRADVQAEFLQARASGQLPIGEAGVPAVKFATLKSRDQVRGETLAAVANGEVRRYNDLPFTVELARSTPASTSVNTAAE